MAAIDGAMCELLHTCSKKSVTPEQGRSTSEGEQVLLRWGRHPLSLLGTATELLGLRPLSGAGGLAEGALFGELAKLVGPDSAGAVQAMLRSASSTRSGIIATMVGIGTLIVTATAVFSELQAALNLIWKVPATGNLGVWHYLKSRMLSFSVILVIGFLLLASLVISTALSTFSDYIDRAMPSFAIILYLVHPALSFGFTALFFGIIFKILPDHPVEWQDVWLGAVLTGILFTIGHRATVQQAHSLLFLYGSITRHRSFSWVRNSQKRTVIRDGVPKTEIPLELAMALSG